MKVLLEHDEFSVLAQRKDKDQYSVLLLAVGTTFNTDSNQIYTFYTDSNQIYTFYTDYNQIYTFYTD